jgi:riboflavin kinase/FMN adenylyltransferase
MSPATAITIGNFDGVHLGHAALVAAARTAVGAAGHVAVLCFDPHPVTVLRPEAYTGRLSTFQQRQAWLRELGADQVIRLSPTREFLSQTPEQFLDTVVREYQPQFIAEGRDFRFGRNRAGSIETLRVHESAHGFRTIVVDDVEAPLVDHSLVRGSSTMIRWLLQHGRVSDAAALLGRPYEIAGRVIRGDQRGRTLGVPTANLDHGDFILPADGIYSGFAQRPDGSCFSAAISVGTKPTFGSNPRVCEAHLIGFVGPLGEYEWPLRISFHRWLRDQLTYSSVEPLIDQLQRDIAAAHVVRRPLASLVHG